MNFLTLKPETFGLDISDLSLKFVKLKKKKNFFKLSSFGESEIKPGIIKEGEIKNEEKLVEIIKESLTKSKGEKLKTKYVVASLPEEKSFLQVIQLPKISEEDLKSAVVFEAENYIPLPIQDVYLDFQVISPVNNKRDHLDIFLTALPKRIVDSYLSCLKLAGLQPVALEIESLAVARALIKNEFSPSSVLLIDFGATRTSFIVFSGSAIRFTSTIAVSSQSFTDALAKNLGVSLVEAERLKLKYGLEEKAKLEIRNRNFGRKKEKGKIFEAMVPALVDLAQQIKRHLDYYQTHAVHEHLAPGAKEISKVLLCGGGANLKGLTDLLSLELKIPVELGNPWINILPEDKKETPELPFEKSLSFTTTLGLALRGMR